jgi:hypothetical protein
MAKVRNFVDLGQIKEPQDFMKHGSIAVGDLSDAVNGGLEFDSNLNTKTVTVTFDAANTETAVTHNLGRIPTGYLASKMSANMVVFDGSRAATSNVSYLKASAPGTITLIFH